MVSNFDAACSKAVVLMLIDCSLYLLFFLVVVSCFAVRLKFTILVSLIAGCTKGNKLKTSQFETLHV